MAMVFEFERPIVELEKRLRDLEKLSEDGQIDLTREIRAIAEKIEAMKLEIYKDLQPWQTAQVARHIDRPSTLDYLKMIAEDFVELHGDRAYADDPSLVGGPGQLRGQRMFFIGHQKGHDTDENLRRNFGMPHPEGYRKALRHMQIAEKFSLPIAILVDTPGAFPGLGAEERGQGEAIARNLREMSRIRVPIMVTVIGEGGSGGALAIGIGDHVAMLEHAIYSVISPEGCAAILWKDAARARDAAQALKITARDLLALGVIDEIIPEPIGGAHTAPEVIAGRLGDAIERNLTRLSRLAVDDLLEQRYQKFRRLGQVQTGPEADHA